MSVTHADFTIERRYPYTPRQTFSAFAEPELRRQWFANPGGWDDAEWELDFRVGGGEVNRGGGRAPRVPQPLPRHRRRRADRVRLRPLARRAVDLGLADHGRVRGRGEGTRLRFTEQGVFFDGEIAAAQREHGTGKLLDTLERFLAGEPVR